MKNATCTYPCHGTNYTLALQHRREYGITTLTITDGWLNVDVCVIRNVDGAGGYAVAYELHPEYGQSNIAHTTFHVDQLVTSAYVRKQLLTQLMHELVTNIMNHEDFVNSSCLLDNCTALASFLHHHGE